MQQQGWDEIAEKLILAINNALETTKKETPFLRDFLFGSSSLKDSNGQQFDALAWRREVNRQQGIALELIKETEKARRAPKNNESLSRREMMRALGRHETGVPAETSDDTIRSLLGSGSRVWLYLDEELLPKDSWEPDHLPEDFQTETILDVRAPLPSNTERAARAFQVK
ncbi:hypothetical protein PHMEG_00015001 [Phytophthora megakarya]|uniref:Reverse transcriptase n=1 Tax=Phytophthora megakarya TaxID=4795 RepID=A0A225W2E9_9STRA|nr:hypothetical protein PHMEG_00015001 [Phytophthora megakarya]